MYGKEYDVKLNEKKGLVFVYTPSIQVMWVVFLCNHRHSVQEGQINNRHYCSVKKYENNDTNCEIPTHGFFIGICQDVSSQVHHPSDRSSGLFT